MKHTPFVKLGMLGTIFALMVFTGCKKELNNDATMTEAEAAEITLVAQEDI
ncbi:MAG: hypothetical protein MUF24_12080 [Chitinophagaceae bacterium]|nr:hypothetical protein [Chitinophagaceae bacterium]